MKGRNRDNIDILAELRSLAPHERHIILWIIRAYYWRRRLHIAVHNAFSIPPWVAVVHAALFWALIAATGVTPHNSSFPAVVALWGASAALLVTAGSIIHIAKIIIQEGTS